MKNSFFYLLFLLVWLAVFSSCNKEDELPKIDPEFEASKTTLLLGDKVQFTDKSLGDPTNWLWSFEGGTPNSSTERSPLVTYNEAGVFSVTVEAANAQNVGVVSKQNYIKVLEEVTADFTVPDKIGQGRTVTFIDNSSGNPSQWSWKFFNDKVAITSNLQNPSIKFYDWGIYSVTLTVQNDLSTSSKTFDFVVLPTDNLLVHYAFSGDAADLSGNGNDGQVEGTSLTSGRKGLSNEAYYFDGLSSQIKFPAIAELNTLPVSISFWVRFDQLNSVLLGTDIADNIESGVWFSIGQGVETLNKIAISYGNGGGPAAESRKTFIANQTLNTNEWYFIVGVVESLDVLKIYINGVETTGTYSGLASSYQHLGNGGSLGRVWDPYTFFNGTIDDFRIYNRVLTPDEINILYQE